jgi:NADPH-dependent 7-cyano-7-deazaguanine reductase QueF
MRGQDLDESEDPSGTLSGENEDGSESFESANESHNPCNESNTNRVMDDFKSEVMGELLEIKGEMKKKDNIILDLLGRLDANQGQQNGNESNINRVMDDFKSEVMGELLDIKGELKKKDDMNFHELLEIKREMKKKDNIIPDLLRRLDANQGQQNGNESNINRVKDDFKSEVMGELLEIKRELKKKDDMNFHELLEIKREMKKKDNIILDLLGRHDANQGQQNGQTRQSTSPAPTGSRDGQTYANKAASKPSRSGVGLDT